MNILACLVFECESLKKHKMHPRIVLIQNIRSEWKFMEFNAVYINKI